MGDSGSYKKERKRGLPHVNRTFHCLVHGRRKYKKEHMQHTVSTPVSLHSSREWTSFTNQILRIWGESDKAGVRNAERVVIQERRQEYSFSCGQKQVFWKTEREKEAKSSDIPQQACFIRYLLNERRFWKWSALGHTILLRQFVSRTN